MPLSCNKTLNPYCFASALDCLVLSTDEQSVDIELKQGETVLLKNTYYPDSEGKVYLYDLDKVVEPYLNLADRNYILPLFMLKIVAGEGSMLQTFGVIPCRFDMNLTPQKFVERDFLTAYRGERETAPDRYETLAVFSPGSNDLKVEAEYYDGQQTRTKTFTLSGLSSGPLNLSPREFEHAPYGRLLRYTATVGLRKAVYRVSAYEQRDKVSLIFLNSFGCWETIHLTGLKEQDPKFTRSTAKVGGRLKTYDIEEEMEWTSNTGPLHAGTLELANELARSKSVFLLTEAGAFGDEIVITDQDIKATDDDADLHDVKFTFRRASRRPGSIGEKPRIFDSTFDMTFE